MKDSVFPEAVGKYVHSCLMDVTALFSAATMAVIKAMCWTVVAKARDPSGTGLVIYQKPTSPSCYEKREENNPPLCENKDGKNSSWYLFFWSYFYDIYISIYFYFLCNGNMKSKELRNIVPN